MYPAGPSVMISHLHKEFYACIGKLVECVPRGDILRIIVIVVYYIAQMDHTFDIQLIRCVNQALYRRIHDIPAVFHRILRIRNQHDIVVILIFQFITLITSILAQILLRIFHQPFAFIETAERDPHFLEASLKELVQRLSTFLPPA